MELKFDMLRKSPHEIRLRRNLGEESFNHIARKLFERRTKGRVHYNIHIPFNKKCHVMPCYEGENHKYHITFFL